MNGILQIPEYIYAGFRPCGCLVTLISDIPSEKKWVSKMVADVIARGDRIERITHTKSVELLNTIGLGCNCDNHQPSQSDGSSTENEGEES